MLALVAFSLTHRECTVRGEGGMSWESSTDIYTPPCVQQIASGKLLLAQGAQLGALR